MKVGIPLTLLGLSLVGFLIVVDAPAHLRAFSQKETTLVAPPINGIVVAEEIPQKPSPLPPDSPTTPATDTRIPQEAGATGATEILAKIENKKEEFFPPPPPTPSTVVAEKNLATYLEVQDGCGPYFSGECLNVRSAPSTDAPSVAKLRTGMILRAEDVPLQSEGRFWYKIVFDEWLRYPERVAGGWYVAAEFVTPFGHRGPERFSTTTPATSKKIIVNRTEQKLYAYEGEMLFMEESISTGRDFTPTPLGTFTIDRKTPSRYMQGPLPGISDDVYDLPGVPWTMYFTNEGAAIHGAYWHDKFGQQWSHGCINLPSDKARLLYEWADVGTPVTVRD